MATISKMLDKSSKDFQNLELDVVLNKILTVEDTNKITLVFYCEKTKSEYKKNYLVNDIKGRVDFNRAMFALGSTKKNYDKWLDRMMTLKIPVKISINDQGFIRYIKVLDKELKDTIAKSLYLDSIEGLKDEDREFLMQMDLETLKGEFGQL
jgi:hypothetical protein